MSDKLKSPALKEDKVTVSEIECPGVAEDYHAKRKDQDKIPVGDIFYQFPNALEELAKVMHFGASKYGINQWPGTPDLMYRCNNCAARHALKRHKGEAVDEESGRLHIAHEIWNLLAMAETYIKENK